MSAEERPRRRRGVAGGERTAVPEQRPFAQPRLLTGPAEVAEPGQIEQIHHASLRILRDIGMEVLDPEARAIYGKAGATVDGQRVRFDPTVIDAHLGLAPAEFTLHSWHPDRHLRIGGNWIAFGSVASAPNVADLDRGRRTGNRRDYQDLLRLCQMLTSIHFIGGYPVEPVDIHASVRHLHATFDALTLTDRPIHAYSLGRQRNRDCLEMVRIARGIDRETLEREPSIFTIINTNSPLRLDVPMSQGIIAFASANQVVCVTPFTLAGAMAPVTLAGALAQQNAEALAGLVLTQAIRPGAPFIYGAFTSNVDMQSGSPAFGTPEYVKAAIIGGQLARRYRLPYRSSNVSAANGLDAQAAYESMFSLWGAITGGVNLLLHGAGWMEGGLHASFEKMVLDADLLHMVSTMLDPFVVDEGTLALDSIAEAKPGGHFFGTAHTRGRFRSAFYRPLISDWRNYESWDEAGRPDAARRANTLWKQMLDAYEPPPLPEETREELADFVRRREAEGGVPVDY